MGLVPKLSAGGIKNAIMSENVIAVGAAILFSAVAANKITELIKNVPFLQDHVVFALIGISVVILIIGIKMKSGAIKAIVIGLAGGSFFVGLMSVPMIANGLAQVQSRVASI